MGMLKLLILLTFFGKQLIRKDHISLPCPQMFISVVTSEIDTLNVISYSPFFTSHFGHMMPYPGTMRSPLYEQQ
ncbi:hypothetical protein J005_00129 [Cryptococcus neoformans]|nr:hypothetical protein C344_00132 [Cryptococcus neoformans var. grubii AD1-7a]OXH40611.1 hypothetical protein J005_00129 [Cryptococcus neoformans var. grubii]